MQYDFTHTGSRIVTFTVPKKKKDVKQRHIHNRFDNTPPRSRFAAAAGLPCFGLVCCADISAAWSWVTSSRDQKEVVTTAHCSRTSQSQDLGAQPEHTALQFGHIVINTILEIIYSGPVHRWMWLWCGYFPHSCHGKWTCIYIDLLITHCALQHLSHWHWCHARCQWIIRSNTALPSQSSHDDMCTAQSSSPNY